MLTNHYPAQPVNHFLTFSFLPQGLLHLSSLSTCSLGDEGKKLLHQVKQNKTSPTLEVKFVGALDILKADSVPLDACPLFFTSF